MFDATNNERWTYKDMPLAALVPEGGTSVQYDSGSWRDKRPIWDDEKCTDCLLCWVSCPDSSILVRNREMTGIDLMHCKGCGVCVTMCRFDALKMINEQDAKLQDLELAKEA